MKFTADIISDIVERIVASAEFESESKGVNLTIRERDILRAALYGIYEKKLGMQIVKNGK